MLFTQRPFQPQIIDSYCTASIIFRILSRLIPLWEILRPGLAVAMKKKNVPLSLKDVQICLFLTEGNVFFRFFFLNLLHHRWLEFFFAIIPNTSIIFYVPGGTYFLDE